MSNRDELPETKELNLQPLKKAGYRVAIVERVNALLSVLCDLYGTDRFVLKASKLSALALLESTHVGERLLALQKIIIEDPTLDHIPKPAQAEVVLTTLENRIAEQLAIRNVEESLERKITQKMQERQEEYYQEIKMQVLREQSSPETPQSLNQLKKLKKMAKLSLSKTSTDWLRPVDIEEIVGQEEAVKSLIAKLASPFPQHVILYGPPGVGKTTAARVALNAARKLKKSVFKKDAPFVEVNGTTIRWDPREIVNPLLGSVHDPIYQGARRDLADGGVPEPKPGLVTDAHGGVLFIDEIGELEPLLMNKLLKVLEDKKVTFESSYYNPEDMRIPQYIKNLFEKGAPADFILIGATTRSPEHINPAIRSRCAEIFFEPLTPQHVKEIVIQSSKRLGIQLEPGVADIISEYTIEGRKANSLLADAYSLALYNAQVQNHSTDQVVITERDTYEVVQQARLVPSGVMRASDKRELGKIFGLGVSGFVGSVLEIEAVIFPARETGKGAMRFNDTAGSMAKDSVFNAASVIRKLTGQELLNYDVHINVVGGGNIDGPSAGLAICLVLLSCIKNIPLKQNIAVTGEVSLQGNVKPVGGIVEKIYGAKQTGMKKVLLPEENKNDFPGAIKGIEVIPVATVEEALSILTSQEG